MMRCTAMWRNLFAARVVRVLVLGLGLVVATLGRHVRADEYGGGHAYNPPVETSTPATTSTDPGYEPPAAQSEPETDLHQFERQVFSANQGQPGPTDTDNAGSYDGGGN